jgi:alpha-beta hydrolase superfamily lysophospholipase
LAEAAAATVETFTASDGYAWRYRRFPAAGPPRGEIVCIHGIQSHGGWYEGSCAEYSQAGYNVSFLDRRGSGLNTQGRGDAPSFRRLLDDIAEYLTQLPRAVTRDDKVATLPVFLIGISWGGKLAMALERRHPGLVDGLVLLCPGIAAKIRVPRLRRLGIFLARWFRPRKLFSIPLSDPELFTATPRWLDFLRHDSLRLHEASARFLFESVRLDGYLRFVPKYVHAPVLLLLAEHDRIIQNAKTRAFVERLTVKDKQIIEYPGAHHTLEFEEPRIFVKHVLAWLENHGPKGVDGNGTTVETRIGDRNA